MPTTNQLILGAQQRLPKKRMRDKKTPALQGSPQKRGVCLRVYTKTPKKPNKLPPASKTNIIKTG